jgi:hypothetical protein
MKSVWRLPSVKPKDGSKIEILWSKTKPSEVDTYENGRLQADFLTWKDVIYWRYLNEES